MRVVQLAILGHFIAVLGIATSVHAEEEYGVDASFPIHRSFIGDEPSVSATLRQFGPNKIELYQEYMAGCKTKYSDREKQCDWNEHERMQLNRDQPRTMTNYTTIGFEKTRLSDGLWKTLREYWAEFMETRGIEKMEEEYWPAANTYTNHWDAPTLFQGVRHLHEPIWREVESMVREWIPKASSFSRSSLYGIRAYTSGSLLATHVDRDPLITSAIINIGQDVDEDWPLEVYGHDGRAQNITMQPGDVVLYESHSVLHGRPFPLQGKYFANIFVHFKPVFDEDEGDQRDEL